MVLSTRGVQKLTVTEEIDRCRSSRTAVTTDRRSRCRQSSANGFLMPVWCCHRIRSPKPSPCPNRTDTIRCNVTFSFRGLDVWYYAVSPSLYINFFNKMLAYLLSVIKKKIIIIIIIMVSYFARFLDFPSV